MNRRSSPDALRTLVTRALDAGDPAAAIEAVAGSWHPLAAEHGEELRDIITALPESSWAHEPAVAIALGASFRTPGSPPAPAVAYLRAAVDSAEALDSPAPVAVEASLHYAAALRQIGDIDGAVERLDAAERRVEAAVADSLPWRMHAQAAIALQRGIVAQHRGRIVEAEGLLDVATGLGGLHLPLAERVEAQGALALCAVSTGDLDAAEARAAEARDAAGDGVLLSGGFGAPALLAELNAAIDRFATSRADALLPDALTAAAGTEWEPFSLELAARLALVEARYVEALDLLRRAAVLVAAWHGERMWSALGGVLRAQVLIRVGQGDEAWSLLARLPSSEHHEACSERFVAELRLLNGDIEGAAAALEPCEALGELHSARTLVEVQLLRSAIELERGAPAASDLWADRALLSMAESGSLMPLLFLPDPLLERIRERALGRRQTDAVRELLERIRHQARPETVAASEQLTSREAAVLDRLRLGETISAIAASLYVSTNTVKTHLRNIYRKLDVGSRDEAVRKAATRGLYLGLTPESPRDDLADR